MGDLQVWPIKQVLKEDQLLLEWYALDGRCASISDRSIRILLYIDDVYVLDHSEPPPERRHNGEHVFRMVQNIHVVYGKKNPDGTIRDTSTPPIEGVPFKKQSIFFQ